MTLLRKLTWLELKLFLREPLTVLFALALPLTILFVMGGVFGNDVNQEEFLYRGVGAMDYYVPAYIALVCAAVGLISLPTHIAKNREQGVLKRYHASGISSRAVAGSQVAVTFVIAAVSGVVMIAAAMPVYDVSNPDSLAKVVGGFVLVALMFAAIGILLGAVMPSSRAGQALGVMLWFVFMMLGGVSAPPEVMTGALDTLGKLTPMHHGVLVMHDAWLSLDPGPAWWVVAAVTVVCGVAAVRFFRWE